MIVAVDTFNAYSGNYEDSADAAALKVAFLESAEEIISSYLSYHPEERLYQDVILTGTDSPHLLLPSRNIKELISLSLDGKETDCSEMILLDDRIRFRDHKRKFSKGCPVSISYQGGWKADEMPAVIRLSIMRIATLMLSETNGNIGLTGKSFADNSRTFINYSNYKKYLEPLDGLRIARF